MGSRWNATPGVSTRLMPRVPAAIVHLSTNLLYDIIKNQSRFIIIHFTFEKENSKYQRNNNIIEMNQFCSIIDDVLRSENDDALRWKNVDDIPCHKATECVEFPAEEIND